MENEKKRLEAHLKTFMEQIKKETNEELKYIIDRELWDFEITKDPKCELMYKIARDEYERRSFIS